MESYIVLGNKSTRTPGTYPKYARIQTRKDFLKKNRVVEGLGYVKKGYVGIFLE